MKRLIVAAFAVALLSGCGTVGKLVGGGPGDVRIPIGKGLLVAELTTTGANVAATTAANSNVCHGPCAVSVSDKLAKLNKAVAQAYKFWIDGNTALAAATITDALSQAVDVSQQAKNGGE